MLISMKNTYFIEIKLWSETKTQKLNSKNWFYLVLRPAHSFISMCRRKYAPRNTENTMLPVCKFATIELSLVYIFVLIVCDKYTQHK